MGTSAIAVRGPIADEPADVVIAGREVVAGGFRPYERVRARRANEDAQTRDLLRAGPAVAVLPIDLARGEVVLIRQFRVAAHLANGKGDLVEIVAGHVEANETPLATARRECVEEIGVAPDVLVELFSYLTSPGLIDEEITLFLGIVDAARVPAAPPAAAEHEATALLHVPIDAALAALPTSAVRNGPLIVATAAASPTSLARARSRVSIRHEPKGEVMIRTPVCDLLQIDHPIALGGMGSVYAPQLVAAVSGAGGLGAMGCHYLTPEQVHAGTAAIRELTNRPFALNFLLFDIEDDSFASALTLRPSVIAFAWPRPEQDVKPYVERAHAAGCKVTFMAGGVPEAVRAAQAGADVIIAQGTEGGGHVGWQTTMTLVPMVVDAVAPIPVLAAGGIADGRGLAAAIMLGADGVLLGTRFLASRESSLHPNFKQAILESNGHDTLLSEIPDIAAGLVWPGAMSRSRRNRFIERWAGREWALRQHQAQAKAALQAARKSGDVEEAVLSIGQDAGLIHDIAPAGDIVSRIAQDAERILTDGVTRFIRKS